MCARDAADAGTQCACSIDGKPGPSFGLASQCTGDETERLFEANRFCAWKLSVVSP